MKQNSTTEFLLMMRDEGSKNNPPMLQLGQVKSINPLQIALGDLPLFEENLYINRFLLDYDETVVATTSAGGSDSHTHDITAIHHNSILKVNDTVILYPINNGQMYIVLGVI
ncbi:DUF2577 domain-containing protein [Clostridium beijerinckii]|uniref:DUF2577 domain-containing protein n=1 Tax=Clostridium beijerinckii TaxID=1520 RepID=A0AAE5HAZ1_CLOBE|nr:DUF2577 domain-containing protein [Clostridium beijerinckii]NSB17430.1 hypothetical protein [Clostridium beijerinckii]OOM28458.1 hypothetical protein CLOBE_27140 [Clostridium beijerinckii]